MLSVDPSSTITHLAGLIDWLITESSVCRMYFDSSRHAEIIKYLEYPDFAELIFAAAGVSGPEANVIPVVFCIMP